MKPPVGKAAAVFEMLLEAIAEMLGLETQPAKRQPPQRRQPTRQQVRNESEAPEQGQVTLEELMREVAGMDATPRTTTKQSGRSLSSGRRERRERGRTGGQGRAREAAPRPAPAVPVEAAPVAPMPFPEPPPAPTTQRKAAAGDATDYAARLRGNPAAARDAFVYAEIFGRPVGER